MLSEVLKTESSEGQAESWLEVELPSGDRWQGAGVGTCMREHHLGVSTLMLRDKARSLIKQHNPSLKASEGWAVKFIHRHRLVLRAHTSVAQKLRGDLESKLSAFLDEVKTERQKYDFPQRPNREQG